MLARCISASLIFAVSCSFAQAQQTSPTSHDKAQDSRLDAMEKKLSDQDKKLTELSDKIDRVGESLRTGIGELKEILKKDRDNQQKALEEIGPLKDLVKNGLDNHEKILTQIAQSDGGRYVPRLSAAMAESETFRRDMAQAVNRSLGTTGRLLVTNKTAYFQWIAVNMRDYGVQPGQRIAIEVPVGTVTTQMPDQAMTNWTVSAPSYEEYVDIVPPYVAARPIGDLPAYSGAATYTRRPVYADPTVYVEPVTWTVAYR